MARIRIAGDEVVMSTNPSQQQSQQFRISGYDALRAARQEVDDALVAPATEPAAWRAALDGSLEALEAAFTRHRTVSELPGGPLDQAVAAKPGMRVAAQRLRNEHPVLLEELASLRAMARSEGMDIEALRWRVSAHQDAVRRHMAKGADLIHEAGRDEGGEG